MQETWVQSLGWEDPLEKGKVTHFSILAWRIPWIIHGVTESDTTGFHSVSYSNTFLWPTAIHLSKKCTCQINVAILFWQSTGCMVDVELCNF